MGKNHLALLQQTGQFVKVRQVEQPLLCYSFSRDHEPVVCRFEADVRVEFKTRWGQVKAPSCPVKVLDGDLDVVYIGEPMLRPLGWMPDQQLHRAVEGTVNSRSMVENVGLVELADVAPSTSYVEEIDVGCVNEAIGRASGGERG